ncbi:MAG TPA: acetylxylan esterase, partial [Opitutaceae bacterium]
MKPLLQPRQLFLKPLIAAAVLSALVPLVAADFSPVLGADVDGVATPDQVRRHLLTEVATARVQWLDAYEGRTDPAQIREHYVRLRARMIESIGELPGRTPLNPRITGAIEADGFRVEKVIFESRPRFFVTANLYLPDSTRFAAPWPGVLVPCGHYMPAKAHDEYQSMGALLALNGMAAMVFDPIEQGERLQSVDAQGRSRFWGTSAHTLDDIQAIPLGQSIARQFIWDGMRAIDYLQSRPEIDAGRIGVTGNSGGGTQTSQLLALDGRIKAAAPSCYISHLSSQLHNSIGDGEQHFFGQLAAGIDHPDLLLMHAPTPVKLLAATHDFFKIEHTWETFRLTKRVFTRLGHSEAVDILENDAGHNFNREQREAAARWLALWLRGENREVREPELKLFTEEELRCTPDGQVMLLPGARSIRDLLREDADRIAATRTHAWAAMDDAQRCAAVRQAANFREMAAIPATTWTPAWSREEEGCRVEAFRVAIENGAVSIPALWIQPAADPTGPTVVFASDEGFGGLSGNSSMLVQLAKGGRRVLAIDVRGMGETKQNNQDGMAAAV